MVLLLGAFLGGMPAQAMSLGMSPDKPCGMAMDMGQHGVADTGAPQDKSNTLPACIALVGCAIFVGLSAPDLSISTPLSWSSAWYGGDLTGLAGRAIEPDLFPPILT